MNDIELNDDKLLKKFDRKALEIFGKELISVKYYNLYSNEDYIIFDIPHSEININTKISDIEELNCIMEIGKKLNILKVEKEEKQ